MYEFEACLSRIEKDRKSNTFKNFFKLESKLKSNTIIKDINRYLTEPKGLLSSIKEYGYTHLEEGLVSLMQKISIC
jgi:hypothetical protein